MLRIRSFALAAAIMLLQAAFSTGAPPSLYSPGHVQPPAYTHYPPTRAFLVPYHPATANWFAPPPDEPRRLSPAPALPAQPPATGPAQQPATTPALRLSPVPRVLREPEPVRGPAVIEVRVPPGTELWFNGAKTHLTGTLRLFDSPPLEPGEWYGYDVKARWMEDGQEVERTRHVSIAAGARVAVDFTKRGAK
jgi:uncharacterized protein (TIGR03000 family)